MLRIVEDEEAKEGISERVSRLPLALRTSRLLLIKHVARSKGDSQSTREEQLPEHARVMLVDPDLGS